ncbi:phosphate ABC transporter permease subunit PstC [Myxococcota bacterium]|nr:phosphate ABC transporter permease subunit PstC [Myxococcota bacterium]MBU1410862.1 phosphate ABC transporter permease subunit PstC [Myxococcota bacterium]MBU1509255.1 phosphate ABC transporter permease subunit PstC [Myxococcota bacterium]PKN21202.1 MAG: phosphate ABC transporter permease subunit PstC [Deltaproteobacteria bacterium HGW-Deltaproteobacteria-22]
MSFLTRSSTHRLADRLFRWLTIACAASTLLLAGAILWNLIAHSWPSISRFGFGFITSTQWNPVKSEYGAASSIYGTLVSTAVALLLALPVSLAIALFLTSYAPPWLARIVGTCVELLAAIPSIIYGMWGLFVFAPYMQKTLQPWLARLPGPLFSGAPLGVGMLTAGIILALMILPFLTAVMRDVFAMTPPVLMESAAGMGSTSWEVTRHISIPHGMRGLVGATFLGLGRAIGETMAVTFVIGNSHRIAGSLFAPGNTIASTLANEFNEADSPLLESALIELGLILFAITLIIQVLAQLWLRSLQKHQAR